MTMFTVFYGHPYYCREGNHYTVDRATAKIAADEALDMLPEEISEHERPDPADLEATSEFETNISIIADDMEIVVFEGALTERPAGIPAYEVR